MRPTNVRSVVYVHGFALSRGRLAELYGMTRPHVDNFVKMHGPDVTEAIERIAQKRLRAAARCDAGVSLKTWDARKRRGWPEERLLEPVGKNNKIRSPLFEAAHRIASQNGMRPGTIYQRLRSGYTEEEALHIPLGLR